MRLAVLFLQRVGERAVPQDPAELGAKLAALLAAGRVAWPEVSVADDEYVAYVADRMRDETNPAAALPAIEAADLYLACACVQGDPAALAALERHFISQVHVYLGRRHPSPLLVDEVKQMLRTRLLVRSEGAPPKIAGYTGRGPLGAWLRVSAVRAAIDLDRLNDRRTSEARDTPPLDAVDPEMAHLRGRYAAEFREAFHRTLSQLDVRDANVLRLYFLEGTPAAAIGAIYGVTSRSVQRWIVEARQRILEETLRLLQARLQLSSSDLDRLFLEVESQVNVSILRVLPDATPRHG